MGRVLILLLLLFSCNSSKELDKLGNKGYLFYENEEIISGYPVKGRVYYYDSGEPYYMTLSKDYYLTYMMIPSGANLTLNPEGGLLKVTYNGYINIYGVDFLIEEGRPIEFYPEINKVKSAYLDRNTLIGNIPCKSSNKYPVIFYPSGFIKSSKIFKTFYSDKSEYRAYTRVDLPDMYIEVKYGK